MAFVRVEQRNAHLAGAVRLHTVQGRDGPVSKATLTAIGNTRKGSGGIIRKRVALLDPSKLDLAVTLFILVRTSQHRIDWFKSFYTLVTNMPEIVECYRVTGSTDYLIKVMVADIQVHDRVYKALIEGAELADVTSMFAMEQIKYTTALPLPSR
ncbi:MAG: Lrp/AsnC family transcriptional regulator [Ideonella sp.]|nr:Lrp/AsnC family transcriptional regulator [Ideonella sp.]